MVNILRRGVNKIKRTQFKDCKTIFVASGQKVGSTWLFDILNSLRYFRVKNIDYYNSEHLVEGGFSLGPTMDSYDFLTSENHATVIKTHLEPPVEWIPDSKVGIINIYRDPRDVILSTINYVSWLPVDKGGWGQEYASLPLTEKFKKFMNADWHLKLLENWHEYDNAYKVSYESLLANPLSEMQKLLDFHSIPYSRKELERVITEYNFKNQKQKAQTENNEYRLKFLSKGVAKQWEAKFNDEMKVIFKKHPRWMKLLIEQGYEDGEEW